MPDDGRPSFKLAMQRAREKLLKDPQTQQPYKWWGFFAPTHAFSRLGEDAATYMRLLQECWVVAVIGLVLAIIGTGGRLGHIGAAERVEWAHVLSDMAMTIIFTIFILRQKRRSQVIDKAGTVVSDISHPHSQQHSHGRRSQTAKVSPRGSGSSPTSPVDDGPPAMRPRRGRPSAHSEDDAALVVQKSFRGMKGRQEATRTAGGPPPEMAAVPTARRRSTAARASGGSEAPHARARSGTRASAGVSFAADESSTGSRHQAARGSMGDRGLMPALKAQGTLRTMANAGEACSLVVWGWEKGEVPQAAIEAMTKVSGEAPWAVLQPRRCAESQRGYAELQQLTESREHLAAVQSAAAATDGLHSAVSKELGGDAADAKAAAAKAAKLSSSLAKVDAELKRVSARVAELAQGSTAEELLPLAFVTFGSVWQARGVLNAGRADALWPRNTLRDSTKKRGQIACAPAEAGAAAGGAGSVATVDLSSVYVGAAPNPSDIRWEHLEIPAPKRRARLHKGYWIMVITLLPASFVQMLSTYYNTRLHATPFFTYCPPPDDGSECVLTFGIIVTNFFAWLGTTLMIIGAFQLVIQPALWLATDGGPCGPSFAEGTTSYTESCLHLMFRVLSFQLFGTLLTAFSFVFMVGYNIFPFGVPPTPGEMLVLSNTTNYLEGPDAPPIEIQRLSRMWYDT